MSSSQTLTLNIKALFDASDVKAKVGDLQNAFKNIKLPADLQKNFDTSLSNLTKALNDFESRAAKGVSSKADAKGLTTSIDNVIKEFSKVEDVVGKIKTEFGSAVDLSQFVKLDDATLNKIKTLKEEIKQLQQQISDVTSGKLDQINEALNKIKSKGAKSGAEAAIKLFNEGNIDAALQKLNEVEAKQKQLLSTKKDEQGNTVFSYNEATRATATENLKVIEELKSKFQEAQSEVSGITAEINTKTAEIGNTAQQASSKVINGATQAANALTQEGTAAANARNNIVDLANGQAQFNREVDQVKSRIQYFFGLNNAINLIKRAIRGAVDTIKDLDKAMTETAVVTDFTVSDMWKQLPEYTKRANELGVTTQAAYEAATLYYQQGLNNEEVNALSVETLKMARIAGLDAAEATDRMTNALRGFNMELDTQSAQRVDDVYSELAANTASNVDEISTAMTKVASLAHSANMEFETTAAFLAQIIETTRESAETAGTALKTVVARFSEVKKLVDTNQLKGQDEEGQVVDVNKVSAALRTAGIDLNKYFLGEVGLDDIFMELASKWDSLTSVQQRYIATQAAGSRQQSRFIALMQDYARTQELVSKAYNAEGASARQFAKTQESLESKLARLKNAWNEFLMGLTNNVMVKTFVDLLTDLLNLVNKLTGAFGDGVGFILKWGVALATIFSGKMLFASGGPIEALLGNLTKGTIFGSLLGKAGIGAGNVAGGAAVGAGSNWAASRLNPRNIGASLLLGKEAVGGFTKKAWGGVTGGLAKMGAAMTGKTIAADGLTALLPGMISQAGAVATAVGGIGLAIGAAVAAYQLWLHNSAEGKLKLATKEAKKLQEAAQESQDQYKSLQKFEASYQEQTEKVNNATTVADREQAVLERNQAILDAIEQDGTLAQYVVTERTDFGIELTVDEAGLAAAIKNIGETARNAAIDAGFGEAKVDLAEADVLEKKLRNIAATGNISEENLSSLSLDALYEWIRSNQYVTSDNQAKAADFYNQILSLRGSAETQARIQYGEVLDSLQFSKELTNALMPVLGDLYAETGKRISDERLGNLKDIPSLLPILNAFSGKLDTSSSSLVNFNIDNEASLATLLGLDGIEDINKAYSDLETALNLQEGQIKNTIKNNAKLLKQQQEQTTQRATEQMIGNRRYSIGTMAQYLSLDNFDYQQVVASMLETLGDVDYSQYLVTPMIEAMAQGDWESSGFQKWVDSIDFSNPIQTFAELSKVAKDTESPFNAIATAILSSNDAMSQFSASSQLAFLTLSSGYDSISESLGKYLEENDHISSGNIKELAESSADLAAMLDSGTMSAKGLAVALEGIETGKWDFLELSDAVLAAMSAMDDLDGIVESTIDDLNSFDPGFDENDITGFINKAFENATENFEKGAYGNNVMGNYMRKIFGNFEWDGKGDYGNAYKQWLQNNISWLENNKDNMFSAWDDFVGTSNQRILQAGEHQAEILEQNGEIIIHANGATTEELVNAMVEQGHMTETMARMMISDFKNYSADFAHEMQENDMPNAIRAWMDALPEIDGAKIYDEADLETLGTLFGKEAEEIKQAVDSLNETATEYRGIRWTDDKGNRTADSIQKTWEKIGTDLTSQVNTSFGNNINIGPELFDYDKIKQAYNNLGIPQMFESDFQTILGDSKAFYADFFGNQTRVNIAEGQTAGEAYAQAYQTAVNQQLAGMVGKEIVAALTESGQQVNIDFLVNKDEVDAFIAEDHIAKGTVNWSNNYPGVPDVPNLEREVHWRNTGAYSGNSDSDAKGGIVQSYASGSVNRKLKPGTALTGEEGPEIVWNKEKGYAYITGESHPEFQNLQPGDRIFDARETRKILQGAAIGGTVPSFAKGYGGATKKTSSGGGGGGGSGSGGKEKTPEEWKNELDWLYNLMEDIAELERDQKAIEEQYEDALKDQTKTGKDLYNLLIKQLGNLYTQLNHQTFALEKREQEMREFMDITNDKDQYLWYNWQDRTIEIDWDAIDQITDEEEYKHVKELIDEAEEIQDKMDDADDAIMDITNQIQELENIWRDTFTDFENRVYDAIVKSYQQVIDNYSELNDTLNNSNSQILDSLQKQISLQRQIRDNTKTEEEIADDEARLAYLRRDTSGGNDLAALQLEKELSEQRQNYEDTLVDQAVNRLQEDNDAAAQQRQQQIDIMQAQLDYQSQNGEFNAAVRELLESAMGADGELLTNSDLVTLLKEQENWAAMSDVSKEVWDEELNGTFKEVVAFLLKQNAEENGTFYTALTSAVNSVSTAIGSYSQAMTKMGNEIASAASGGGGGGGGGGSPSNYNPSGSPKSPESYGVGTKTASTLAAAAKAAETASRGYGTIAEYTNQLRNKGVRFATGGLSTKTGLAWLDGTPSEPEYVLNARQTDAFLKLADVLPSMMGSGAGAQTNTFGSTYITMPVTLESVNPDYDVDRMVDLLKDKLYDAGSYRNVNSLSFIR